LTAMIKEKTTVKKTVAKGRKKKTSSSDEEGDLSESE
jgi:hypothetical protein